MSSNAEHRRTEERTRPGTIDDRAWHFDRSVSFGHIISTLVLAGSVIGFLYSQNVKLEVMNTRINAVESRLEREMIRHTQDVQLIRDQLHRMENKLDRVIERESR